jgi:hypothetical protein
MPFLLVGQKLFLHVSGKNDFADAFILFSGLGDCDGRYYYQSSRRIDT